MKLSFSTIGCPSYAWTDIYPMAKDLGFDGIEIRSVAGNSFAPTAQPFLPRLRARTREFVLRLPLAVRACVAVPLWAIGWTIVSIFSLLWGSLLSPVGAAIAKWVVIALMLLAALAITVKTVFPKTPLKKIFNKRSLLWVLGGSTVFCIADVVLRHFYPDAPRLLDIAGAVASAALLLAAVIPVLKHEKKARDKLKQEEKEAREREEAAAREAALEAAKETPEQAQARVEREILELADSVCVR